MPELPEAETIKRGLERVAVGKRIVDVQVPVVRVLRMPPDEFESRVKGHAITGAGRRAKHIILYLDSGDALVFHLMIAGTLLYMPVDSPRKENTQVILVLNDGHELRFRDPRKFGYVKLLPAEGLEISPEFSHLGPEPLSDAFTMDVFRERLARRARCRIKALLLQQTFVAGIGNIYADEILFYARIHPERVAGSLTDAEVRRLYEGIRSILTKGIEERGSSIATYTDLLGNPGNFTSFFKVYDRTGKPCANGCGGVVVKIKVASRGTHICPSCQKLL